MWIDSLDTLWSETMYTRQDIWTDITCQWIDQAFWPNVGSSSVVTCTANTVGSFAWSCIHWGLPVSSCKPTTTHTPHCWPWIFWETMCESFTNQLWHGDIRSYVIQLGTVVYCHSWPVWAGVLCKTTTEHVLLCFGWLVLPLSCSVSGSECVHYKCQYTVHWLLCVQQTCSS